MTGLSKLYLVGGAVRDIVMEREPKDFDFACEFSSFEDMRDWLTQEGFEIFLETPQYFTVRARAKKGFTFAGRDLSGKTFDFALCRTEEDYTDGRRPDTVKPATILSDLSRRDFTMNAMAMNHKGKIIDPFDGQEAIQNGLITCVGDTEKRFEEDALRYIRAMRFTVQLDFGVHPEIRDFLEYRIPSEVFKSVSTDRIRDELTKMFKANSRDATLLLSIEGFVLEEAINRGIWFEPTSKGK